MPRGWDSAAERGGDKHISGMASTHRISTRSARGQRGAARQERQLIPFRADALQALLSSGIRDIIMARIVLRDCAQKSCYPTS